MTLRTPVIGRRQQHIFHASGYMQAGYTPHTNRAPERASVGSDRSGGIFLSNFAAMKFLHRRPCCTRDLLTLNGAVSTTREREEFLLQEKSRPSCPYHLYLYDPL